MLIWAGIVPEGLRQIVNFFYYVGFVFSSLRYLDFELFHPFDRIREAVFFPVVDPSVLVEEAL